MPNCWSCGAQLPFPRFSMVPREDTCPGCRSDLHSCRNCRHHDPAVNNQCREPHAEWVTDRERANFCEMFQLAETPIGGGGRDRSKEARRKLDGLFG
jgi:hypothetical protein